MTFEPQQPGQGPDRARAADPAVSVIVPCFNSAAYIDAALRSVREQTLTSLEIIVVDDASEDDTRARIAAHAAADERVRPLLLARNSGPSAARNRALDVADGRWIAIMDSDDLMDPTRLERLVAAAEDSGADIACDNVELFFEDAERPPMVLLQGPLAREPAWIDAPTFVQRNCMRGDLASLGYLKPIIRTDFVRAAGLRYDEGLRLAEDYDFMVRMLAEGGALRVFPWATYRYRKHPASLSRRTSDRMLRALLEADRRFRLHPAAQTPAMCEALESRRRSIEALRAFMRVRAALMRGRTRHALRIAWRHPGVIDAVRIRVLNRLRVATQDLRPRFSR